MDTPRILDWFNSLGALSGYAALGWTIFQERRDRSEEEAQRLLVNTRRDSPEVLHLVIDYRPPSMHTAFSAEVIVIAPLDAAIYSYSSLYKTGGGLSRGREINAAALLVRPKTLKGTLSRQLMSDDGEGISGRCLIHRPGGLQDAVIALTITDAATKKTVVRRRRLSISAG